MSDAPVIRTATPADREAIVALVGAAFGEHGRDAGEEVTIVKETWASDRYLPDLELVAEEGGVVVGHVLTALGDLAGVPLPAVAPLGVSPARQGLGIGSALMTELVARCERAGYPGVFLLGSDRYYSRFGFEAAGPLGVVYPPAGQSSPHFQVRRFPTYDRSLQGEFVYCWELAAR